MVVTVFFSPPHVPPLFLVAMSLPLLFICFFLIISCALSPLGLHVQVVMLLTFVSKQGPVTWPLQTPRWVSLRHPYPPPPFLTHHVLFIRPHTNVCLFVCVLVCFGTIRCVHLCVCLSHVQISRIPACL